LLDPGQVGNVVRIRVFVLTACQLSPVSRPPDEFVPLTIAKFRFSEDLAICALAPSPILVG
jgi:hypothetical protein